MKYVSFLRPFLVAVLQSLFQISPLSFYFLSGMDESECSIDSPTNPSLSWELGGLFQEINTKKECSTLESSDFLGALKQFLPSVRKFWPIGPEFLGRQYTDGEQYDAHEFLMSFLDKMHDELNISSNSKKIKSLVRLNEKIEQLMEGESHWKNSLMANSSIITDLFQVWPLC